MTTPINFSTCYLKSCEAFAKVPCNNCKKFHYCSEEHQTIDNTISRKACLIFKRKFSEHDIPIIYKKRKIIISSSTLTSLSEDLFGMIFSYLNIQESLNFIYVNKEYNSYYKNKNFLTAYGSEFLLLSNKHLMNWLPHLKNFSHIKHLDLTHCENLTDREIVYLNQLTNVQYLTLSWCTSLTDKWLSNLTKTIYLESLDLSGCINITDTGIAHLKTLTALKHLNLKWCIKLSDNGIFHLTKLLSLSLSCCINLTNEAMRPVGQMTNLLRLDLSWCKITDFGIALLGGLAKLEYLDLSYSSSLTDASLRHLKEFKRLQFLEIQGCSKLTDRGIKDLQKSLPNLNIIK